MEKKIPTSVGQETASETLARITKAAEAWNTPTNTGAPTPPPSTKSDAVINMLTERLTKQGQGISTSSSSNLQASINEAIASTQKAGELGAQRLQSEREREVSFAEDRAGTTYTTALEGRTGYATQVAALRELTETTEKSVRDLDKRYQEAILANDSATASTIAGLQIKKLEFQQQQEQNFYNNIFALSNLQESALNRQQQNEQFWKSKEQDQMQFEAQLTQSDNQFEQNYGLQLQEFGLKEKQLEIERARYNLSVQEYADRKKELTKEKDYTYTKAVIANEIKNSLQGSATKLTREQILNPNFMLKMAEQTGFDGSTEELAQVMSDAYSDVSTDKGFMAKYLGAPVPMPFTTSKSTNQNIVSQNNMNKLQYDKDRGVSISSPESVWSKLFN